MHSFLHLVDETGSEITPFIDWWSTSSSLLRFPASEQQKWISGCPLGWWCCWCWTRREHGWVTGCMCVWAVEKGWKIVCKVCKFPNMRHTYSKQYVSVISAWCTLYWFWEHRAYSEVQLLYMHTAHMHASITLKSKQNILVHCSQLAYFLPYRTSDFFVWKKVTQPCMQFVWRLRELITLASLSNSFTTSWWIMQSDVFRIAISN